MKSIPAASFCHPSFLLPGHPPPSPSLTFVLLSLLFSSTHVGSRISVFFQFNSAPKINHKSPDSLILSTGWLSQ